MGKELDSLADLVSFGLAPSVIIYKYMQQLPRIGEFQFWIPKHLPFISFLITIFSALRLAYFQY
jgi:CDP-diacylglycerol---serine O-phosphatidyltransferase